MRRRGLVDKAKERWFFGVPECWILWPSALSVSSLIFTQRAHYYYQRKGADLCRHSYETRLKELLRIHSTPQIQCKWLVPWCKQEGQTVKHGCKATSLRALPQYLQVNSHLVRLPFCTPPILIHLQSHIGSNALMKYDTQQTPHAV